VFSELFPPAGVGARSSRPTAKTVTAPGLTNWPGYLGRRPLPQINPTARTPDTPIPPVRSLLIKKQSLPHPLGHLALHVNPTAKTLATPMPPARSLPVPTPPASQYKGPMQEQSRVPIQIPRRIRRPAVSITAAQSPIMPPPRLPAGARKLQLARPEPRDSLQVGTGYKSQSNQPDFERCIERERPGNGSDVCVCQREVKQTRRMGVPHFVQGRA
jgi:hypothetical protein